MIKKDIERIEKKQRLKEIFEQTEKDCRAKEIIKVQTEKVTGEEFDYRMSFVYEPLDPKKSNIDVVNQDCILAAQELVLKGKTCILNMANTNTPGGGVRNGAMAQEEELCRRSNLIFGLRASYYPLQDGFVYSKNIKFFKDGDYNEITPFRCDVITIAAPNLIPFKDDGTLLKRKTRKLPKDYTKTIDEKINKMLLFPATQGVKNLVLSAFGCGAFRNNPIFISSRFKKQLVNLPYDNIYFAILDDHNSIANGISNFQKFSNTLK